MYNAQGKIDFAFCGCHITAIIQASQACDVGSTPIIRFLAQFSDYKQVPFKNNKKFEESVRYAGAFSFGK